MKYPNAAKPKQSRQIGNGQKMVKAVSLLTLVKLAMALGSHVGMFF